VENSGDLNIVKDPGSPTITEKSPDGKMAVTDCLELPNDWTPIIWEPAKLHQESSAKLKEIIFYPSNQPGRWKWPTGNYHKLDQPQSNINNWTYLITIVN